MLDLSVVIVNWNTCEFLRRCLTLVLSESSGLELEVIVVDNASQDESLNMLATEFPEVEVIANATNVGFAAANNQAIARATARYLVLLNPDTEIIDEALVKMVNYLDQHPTVGVVGPKLVSPTGTVQGGAAGYDPSLVTVFTYALMLHSLFPHRVRSLWLAKKAYKAAEIEVDWVAGACLMIRASTIRQVGLLNTSYFMYAEDIEWCHRIKRAGWRLVCLSEASVVHCIGASTRQKGREFARHNIKGLDTYYRSRYSNVTRLVLHFGAGIGFLLRAIIYRVSRRFGVHREYYTESQVIMWECVKSSFGYLVKPFDS